MSLQLQRLTQAYMYVPNLMTCFHKSKRRVDFRVLCAFLLSTPVKLIAIRIVYLGFSIYS